MDEGHQAIRKASPSKLNSQHRRENTKLAMSESLINNVNIVVCTQIINKAPVT